MFFVSNTAYIAKISVNPTYREAVLSNIPSRTFAFSRIPHYISVKSRIQRIPFQTLYLISVLQLAAVMYDQTKKFHVENKGRLIP